MSSKIVTFVMIICIAQCFAIHIQQTEIGQLSSTNTKCDVCDDGFSYFPIPEECNDVLGKLKELSEAIFGNGKPSFNPDEVLFKLLGLIGELITSCNLDQLIPQLKNQDWFNNISIFFPEQILTRTR